MPPLTPHSPDAALATLTLGIALIFWELNRPGSILPGALGLLLTLFAFAAVLHAHPQPIGFVLIATATATLALGLRRNQQAIVPIAATLTLILGLFTLTPAPSRQHAATALLCGLTLGAASALLSGIAHRARTNKGLD